MMMEIMILLKGSVQMYGISKKQRKHAPVNKRLHHKRGTRDSKSLCFYANQFR